MVCAPLWLFCHGNTSEKAINMVEREERAARDDLGKIEGMAFIRGGDYWIGSEEGQEDESPRHRVTLKPYRIGKYEVTNAEYCLFLNEKKAAGEIEERWININDDDCGIEDVEGTYAAKQGREMQPVVELTWWGAQAYCEWKGGSLPTEAEWEVAARGGFEDKKYPWGDEIDEHRANYNYTEEWRNHSMKNVGQYPPNGYGIYDTCGNAWEWVYDWYDEKYYEVSPEDNPRGPESGKQRCVRGGCWADVPKSLRNANRGKFRPENQRGYLSFRCVIHAD
jgi:formylglycine-generating enzyme required for sulfatase activity